MPAPEPRFKSPLAHALWVMVRDDAEIRRAYESSAHAHYVLTVAFRAATDLDVLAVLVNGIAELGLGYQAAIDQLTEHLKTGNPTPKYIIVPGGDQ